MLLLCLAFIYCVISFEHRNIFIGYVDEIIIYDPNMNYINTIRPPVIWLFTKSKRDWPDLEAKSMDFDSEGNLYVIWQSPELYNTNNGELIINIQLVSKYDRNGRYIEDIIHNEYCSDVITKCLISSIPNVNCIIGTFVKIIINSQNIILITHLLDSGYELLTFNSEGKQLATIIDKSDKAKLSTMTIATDKCTIIFFTLNRNIKIQNTCTKSSSSILIESNYLSDISGITSIYYKIDRYQKLSCKGCDHFIQWVKVVILTYSGMYSIRFIKDFFPTTDECMAIILDTFPAPKCQGSIMCYTTSSAAILDENIIYMGDYLYGNLFQYNLTTGIVFEIEFPKKMLDTGYKVIPAQLISLAVYSD